MPKRTSKTARLRLRVSLTLPEVAALFESVQGVVRGESDVIVDCSETNTVDAAGIQLLAVVARTVRQRHRAFEIINVPPVVDELIELMGIRGAFASTERA